MYRRLHIVAQLMLALLALSLPAAAVADSWGMPKREIYFSADRQARLIVTPNRTLARDQFEGQGAAKRPGGKAKGRLERRGANSRWLLVWEIALVNEIAPVSALVANSGDHVVTFDDWGGVGTSDNVVVIYGEGGRLVRSLSLSDLLPEDYLRTLPATVSSIYWGGEHALSPDGETLQLSLALPGAMIFPGGYFQRPVTLATGEPGALAGAEWDRAVAAAAAWRVAQRDEEIAYRAFKTNPLTSPRSSDRKAWDAYLDEAFERLVPDGIGGPWKMLVRAPTEEPYHGAFSPDPKTIFGRRDPPAYIAIASPEGVALAPALAPLVAKRRPGWLRGVRIYVVADDTAWPDLVRLLTPSGASLTQLDPNEPIAQRPERLPPSP